MVLAQEFLLDAKEACGRAVAVGAFMFSTADITMILMYTRLVRAAAFGASDKRFGSFAVWGCVTKAEASGTLEEGWTALKGADGGLAAEEVRG
jgi:hypothetical protein